MLVPLLLHRSLDLLSDQGFEAVEALLGIVELLGACIPLLDGI